MRILIFLSCFFSFAPVFASPICSARPRWPLNLIKGQYAENRNLIGQGMKIAVIDSGIDRDHPAFAGVEIIGRDFTGIQDPSAPYPYFDEDGHGTHVAGIIAGRDCSGNPLGLAPGATLFVARVCGAKGCKSEDIASAIEWAVAEKVDVINISIEGDSLRTTNRERAAVRSALASGISVVTITGNGGDLGADNSVASIDGVIVVGAVNERSEKPFFSQKGFQTLAAPGVNILSAYPRGKGFVIRGESPSLGPSMSFVHLTNTPLPLALSAAVVDVGFGSAESFLKARDKIAFADQGGDIGIEQKARAAQEAGALALVVLMNASDFTAGLKAHDGISIPVLLISKADREHFVKISFDREFLNLNTDVGDYILESGTSMAAPFVTGAAALMKSARRSLNPFQVRDILRRSAVKPLGHFSPTEDSPLGAGILNIERALTLLKTSAEFTFASPDFNGAAGVNGCSGAVFIMEEMAFDQKALLITNGHCVRLKSLIGGAEDFPRAGESVFDIENALVPRDTTVVLHSGRGSFLVRAEKLIFATMTRTDVAIFQLEESYANLRRQYGLEPFKLGREPLLKGDRVDVHAGHFNRTQTCAVENFVDLREGPYETSKSIRLTSSCDIYRGFSGSPILRAGSRTFSGVANTHFDDESEGPPCGLNKPCEIDVPTGRKTVSEKGRSYGVSTDFLYRCFDPRTRLLDFDSDSCPYRRPPTTLGRFSSGGHVVPAADPLDNVLVAIGNAKSQFCTGTFVARDVVLTAAHCVAPDEKGNEIGQVGDFVYPLSLPEGFDPLRGERIRIEKVSLHPRKDELDIWIKIGETNRYPLDNPDLALLKLAHPYGKAKPARLAKVNGRPGPIYSSAGFGLGHENWQRPSRIHFTFMKQDGTSVGADYADLKEGNTFDFMKGLLSQFDSVARYFSFVRSGKPGVETLCYGDSGSPLYLMDGEQMTVFGVASLFIPHPVKGHHGCGDSYLNVFAKIAPQWDWLQREIAALTAER